MLRTLGSAMYVFAPLDIKVNYKRADLSFQLCLYSDV
jgi:hypothetical protein